MLPWGNWHIYVVSLKIFSVHQKLTYVFPTAHSNMADTHSPSPAHA